MLNILERTPRERRAPSRYALINFVIDKNTREPSNSKEAMESPNREGWVASMMRELESMTKHRVWKKMTKKDLEPQNIVTSKWVFKHKYDEKGRLVLLKSRLVARGFSQVPGIDYDETFTPV